MCVKGAQGNFVFVSSCCAIVSQLSDCTHTHQDQIEPLLIVKKKLRLSSSSSSLTTQAPLMIGTDRMAEVFLFVFALKDLIISGVLERSGRARREDKKKKKGGGSGD